MAKPRLRLVAPATENRTVRPRRPKNGELRTREHLTIDEVERLIEAAKANRYGHRDALMVLLAFRHGCFEVDLVPTEVTDFARLEAMLSHGRTDSCRREVGNQNSCSHASPRLRLQIGE